MKILVVDDEALLVKGIREETKKTISKIAEDFFFEYPGVLQKELLDTKSNIEVLIGLVLEFAKQFQKKKRDKNIIDFGDMEHFALDILVKKVDGELFYTEAAEEFSRRFEEILIQEGLPSNYKIDDKLQAAIDIYKKHIITPGSLLVQRSLIAADKLGKFLEEIDLTAEDDKGKPKYTINSVASAIKQVPQLVKDLQEAQKMLSKEIEEEGRARGGNTSKTLFEDGFNFDFEQFTNGLDHAA